MRRYVWAIPLILLLLPFPTTAQDDCEFDFSKVIPMLEAAKTVDEVAQARTLIQLQEAECYDYNPDDPGNSRTNPVPFGERQYATAKTYQADIQLTEFNDEAEAALLVLDDYNAPAPAGMRYVMVSFNFHCNRWPDETCDYSRIQFSLVGDKALSYKFDSANVQGLTQEQELFGGGSITAAVAFLVDDNDSNFVLFTEYGDPRVFFATELVSQPQSQNITVPQQSQVQQPAASGLSCPRTCATAVASGMSAEDAAKCPGLDRNQNGVACYGS